MTFEEIKEALKAGGDEATHERLERLGYYPSPKHIDGLPDFEVVYRSDTGEYISHIERVVRFYGDIYVRFTGTYQSYSGTEYDLDSIVQVYPVEKKIIVYETK